MQVHIEKGVIKAEDLTAMIEELESYGSRGLGARIIARYVVLAISWPPFHTLLHLSLLMPVTPV